MTVLALFLRSKKLCLGAALLGTTLLATGCASTATGVKQSSIVGLSKAQSLQTQAPAGSVLAVIRYPAVVETAAKNAYYDAFESSTIGGSYAKDGDAVQRQTVADSVIVKSNYFALSLYKEMAARLPDHGVLLSPHAVKLDANGKLTSEPITKAESLPSVVSVDFVTYSFPDIKKMMSSEPLTFGDLVTPLVSVRTDHRASAATQGVLFASAPLVPYAAGTGKDSTKDAMDTMQRGQFDKNAPELDFISYLSKDTRVNVPTKSLSSGQGRNSIVSYPVEKIKLDGVALSRLNSANDGTVDPLERVFSDAMAGQIINVINQSDVNKAVMVQKAAAIAEYDPSLAALTFVGSDKADFNARLRYAERLLDAERKYLSVQSLRIFDGIHNGEMGAQMRDMIAAEYKVIEERRQLELKKRDATIFAILGAVAATTAIVKDRRNDDCVEILRQNTPRTRNEQILIQEVYEECLREQERKNARNNALINLAIQGSIAATTEAISLNSRSKAVGSNYLSSIVPALEQQTSVTVDLLDSSETITAIRYEDLKSKLQNLYTSKQRSLDTVATRCGFDQNGSASGTWMGVCEGGKANGSGAGVIQNVDGSAVEYYGYASNGLANGPGLMIVHGQTSSYSIEGNFVNGVADGTMKVSKPGQTDKFRTYSAGQDVGGASQKSLSPFNFVAAR